MKDAIQLTGLVAAVMAVAIILPVSAAMPTHTGINYPDTFWSRMDYTNTVTGKVIASSDASLGLAGAYVAIVNASNVDEEYCHTTSDANGSYSFTNVNATFYQKPDRYDPLYMIYAYKEGFGEGYSTSFGIDVSAIGTPVEIWVVIPVDATKSPSSSIAAITPTATIVSSPTTEPVKVTTMPSAQGWSLKNIAIYSVVIILVLLVAGAYLYIRRR